MKELTIIEKAKRYDEAIKYGQYLINECCKESTDGSFHRADLQKMFPELAESEDERIRKYLIDVVNDYCKGSEHDGCIAWLEKRGEKAKYHEICDKCVRQPTCQSDCFLQQGEQKPSDKIEPKFKAGDKIISTISTIPYYVTEVCNGYYLTDVGCIIMFNAQDNFELVEQKPVWSEEDKRIIDNLISQLGNLFARKLIKEETKDKYVNWLKSIKPQLQWKPSDEQIDALEDAIADAVSSIQKNMLNSLYSDLKKLREE